MRESGRMDSRMEKDFLFGKMVTSTQESGKMVCWKEEEFLKK